MHRDFPLTKWRIGGVLCLTIPCVFPKTPCIYSQNARDCDRKCKEFLEKEAEFLGEETPKMWAGYPISVFSEPRKIQFPDSQVTNIFRKTCGNARTREGVSSVTSQYCIEKLMPRRIMSFNTGESLFKNPSHERTLTGLHPTSLNAKARG